ncbi:DUF3568 family protein [Francisella frigiditurris]|uniref:Lipoprotein n=1 Tax=Francisella frigiditurris TaxID=1542390 RepID=A0A1J0KVZ9_9GAMM|nr:DUF3568 family protein [Francisella frigiditurris]APC97796.1 hypothetical protein KX01_461 [Francisella frigiditurris]
MKKIYLVIFASFIAFSLNSCVTAAILIGGAALAAGGVYYYQNGNYVIEVPNTMRDAYSATIKTFQTNSSFYTLKDKSIGSESATVTAETKNDADKITVTIELLGPKLTSIKIRYGTLGDEKLSAKIADQITGNLTENKV